MLTVTYAECQNAECRYAECRCAECRGTLSYDPQILPPNGARYRMLRLFVSNLPSNC